MENAANRMQQTDDQELIELKVKIDKIFYSKNNYFIGTAYSEGVNDKYLTAYGNFSVKGYGILEEALDYLLKGKWQYDSGRGNWVFIYSERSKILPDTRAGIISYLCSSMFNGIGPKLAEKIVDRFGDDTLKIMEIAPERLKEVPGIGEKKYDTIITSYKKDEGFEKISMFLMPYSVSMKKIVKIYEIFGDQAENIIRKDPYVLCEKIDGIGFRTADLIGRKIGYPADSFSRLKAGILYVLSEAAGSEGHLYLPKDELEKRFNKLFGNTISQNRFREVILLMDQNEFIIRENNNEAIYLPHFYKMERYVTNKIKYLNINTGAIPNIDSLIKETEKENNIIYEKYQNKAIKTACENNFCVITGGPGTGKSTIIKAIVAINKKHDKNLIIKLAAPTGRASKRMEETTGHDACTIHRLLEYSQFEGGFQRNHDNPLDCDVLVVDEGSMIDIDLFSNLLQAIKKGTKIALVGDIDQLPPVGPGYVLRDLIKSGAVPVVELDVVFRQAEGSIIKGNAKKMKLGNSKFEEVKEQFEIINFSEMADYQEKMYTAALLKFKQDVDDEKILSKGNPLYNVQVLSPTWKGKLGVSSLNKGIQEMINPAAPDKAEIVFTWKEESTIYRVGDKVMQTSNNYDKEVFNGDLGIITKIVKGEKTEFLTVTFENDVEVEYERSEIKEELMLAYASTVHKTQGSEFNRVIYVNSIAHMFALSRNILYTGITRAKIKVTLINNPRALPIAVKTIRSALRYSMLEELLKAE